ncbi:MAG: hypothetical protein PHT07_22095 [Paludibacter sp.]|nr:hypothetical protein [Paludibacter sp.]
MKNSSLKTYPYMKQVFSDSKNNFQGSSKYPLGEDFYSFNAGDKDSKIDILSKTILPDTKN